MPTTIVTCEYRNGLVCKKASEMAESVVTTTDKACELCLMQPTRTNRVTASLALGKLARPLPVEKQYLQGLLATFDPHSDGPGTELGPTLWRELFLTIESQTQLEYWESRIPNYQCGGKCKRFYLDWKKNNPPAFPLSFNWKWKLKNAVNAKLGQKIMSLDDAFAFWSSQRGNDV
jgi:hypothetical protein